ncbi:MAG: threonylcarbamoyl-AMP synthase [Clostridia bacterium]|nr:threonylcarbamoyl-AMP synthase [Clostridia bacterium]
MQTKFFSSSSLQEAADLIHMGETVVFPTETVYGLGADAFNAQAVLKIFKAKNRPADNPLIAHISSLDMIDSLTCDFNPMAQSIAASFMPGPITLVLKKNGSVPDAVTAGLPTVGIRFPKNEVARTFISLCNTPIAAPSANISGTVSATTFEDVKRELSGRVGGIIEGENCEFGIESTVVDVTGEAPVILRPGSITLEMLREILPQTKLHPSLISETKVEKPASPGMKYIHYSPKAEVVLVYGEREKIVTYFEEQLQPSECLFLFQEELEQFSKNKMSLGSAADLNEMAHRIFRQLKQVDLLGYQRVYIPAVEETGIGLSVMNRLKKSSGGKAIHL